MVDLEQLFAVMCSGLGNGQKSDRLTKMFPVAVNRALNELAVNTDSQSWPDVSGTNGMLDFPFRYEYVLSAGVEYWLIRMGFSPSDPKIATVVYNDTEKRWTDGKGEYQMDVDNIRQHDPHQDMIAWGHLPDREDEARLA